MKTGRYPLEFLQHILEKINEQNMSDVQTMPEDVSNL